MPSAALPCAVDERERRGERPERVKKESANFFPALLIFSRTPLGSKKLEKNMKRIVKLSACFAALAAAYVAALARPGLLQGRDRLIVALVRESERGHKERQSEREKS